MKDTYKMWKASQVKNQKDERKKAQHSFKNKSKTVPEIRRKIKRSNYLVLHGK